MFCKFLTVGVLSLMIVGTQTSYSMLEVGEVFIMDSFEDNSFDVSVSSKDLKNAVQSVQDLDHYLKSHTVNDHDETGSTLLHHATCLGNFEIVERLVKVYCADQRLKNDIFWTARGYALYLFHLTQNPCYTKIAEFLNLEIPYFND